MSRLITCVLSVSFILPAAAQEWVPQVRTTTYSISGSSGAELYNSIGEKGPLIGGKTRTIAHTNWALKWSRKYVPEGSSCMLLSAKPFLTISYTLPKPSKKLEGEASRKWDVFLSGIKKHEQVHGKDITAMVNEILSSTVGLRVEDDAKCQKIRAEVLELVKLANENYKAKSRLFDQTEMSDGGTVQQLILALVN